MPETSPPPTRLLAGHDPHRLAALALMAEPVADAADAADTAEDADKPWTTFGGIDLHEEIGRGGMGVVYRARQRALDRIVAVKVLLRAQFASKEERARFHREAQAAARLRHPSIVTVHEVGEDEGVPWFSMDFIPGKSLEQVVRDYPMAERTAALCVQKISAAIQHAHEHGWMRTTSRTSPTSASPVSWMAPVRATAMPHSLRPGRRWDHPATRHRNRRCTGGLMSERMSMGWAHCSIICSLAVRRFKGPRLRRSWCSFGKVNLCHRGVSTRLCIAT
jgi:hypothetical protein